MEPTTMLKLYMVCVVTFYGYFVKQIYGQTYSFEQVDFMEARNRCMLASEDVVCQPDSKFCDPKDTISDTSRLDSTSTWIDGFYYKSMWMVKIGCYYMLDSDLARLAVKHILGQMNNIDNCAVKCGNTSFYGLVNDTCFCIGGILSYLTNVPTSFCDMPCPGDPSEKCGSPRENLQFLTVYDVVEGPEEGSSMNYKTCRAINYTTNTNYELINRDCSEKLGFSCRPNSASTSPKFYNYGNSTWEEAKQFCESMDYILSDNFFIDEVFTSTNDAMEVNTLYWVGQFSIEKNYWGQDLPVYGENDPKPKCLSLSGTSGNYNVMKSDCMTSQSALCLQELTDQNATMEVTTMQHTTMVEQTSTAAQTATEDQTSTGEQTTSASQTTTMQETTIMADQTTMEATSTMGVTSTMEVTTSAQPTTTAEQTTTKQATTTQSRTQPTTTTQPTTSTTLETASVNPGGQAAQQTSNAGVYVGVPLGLILAVCCVLLVGFLILRFRKNNRRVVYRVEEGQQRASNPVLDPDDHYNRQKELRILNPVTRKNTARRRNLEECIEDETNKKEQNRMTTGPLTDGSHTVVDLEAVESPPTTTKDEKETTVDNNATTSLYDRPKNNGSLKRESIESSHSNEVVIPTDGGDNICINDSTENLIQSEEELDDAEGVENREEKIEGDEKRNSTRKSITNQNDTIGEKESDETIDVDSEQDTNNDESVSSKDLNESTEGKEDENDKEQDKRSSNGISANDATDNDIIINDDGEVSFTGMTDSTEQLIQSDEDDDEKELHAEEDGNKQETEPEKRDSQRGSAAMSGITNESNQDDNE